jgi:hypothetical protein
MQFSVAKAAILITSLLPSFIAADACVAGGPANQVDNAEACCHLAQGKWFQKYDVQAICVMTVPNLKVYNDCVNRVCGTQLNTVCISCDYNTDCGLKPISPA